MDGWWSLYIFGYLFCCMILWWAVRKVLLWLDRRQRRQLIYKGLRYGGRVPWEMRGQQARPNLRRV